MRSVALVIGGGGSVALTLYVGRENSSVVLMTLFVFWVLSPFVGLAVADALSKRWSVSARAALRAVTLIIAAGSLAIYGTKKATQPQQLFGAHSPRHRCSGSRTRSGMRSRTRLCFVPSAYSMWPSGSSSAGSPFSSCSITRYCRQGKGDELLILRG